MPDKQPFHRDLDIEVLDERARLPDRRGRGAGVVARIAARGPLFRHARFLRRARPHDDAAAAGRARQDLPDHPSRSAGQAGEVAGALRRQRVDASRSSRSRYKEKGVEKPDAAVAASSARSRRRRRGALRAVVRATRISEIELSDVDARKTIAKPRGRLMRWTRLAACTPPASTKTALSFDHVDRVAGDRSASKDARARAGDRDDRRVPPRRSQRSHVASQAKPATVTARDVGSRHQPRRIAKRSSGKLAAYPGGQGVQGRPVVSRPRHLGDGDHAADAERAGVARQADRATSRRSSSPAGSTRTKCRRRATSCGSASCSPPTRATRRS